MDFKISISGNGMIHTTYIIENPPHEYILECGVSYILNNAIDRLTWDKESPFSGYPSNHIGRPNDMAYRWRKTGTDTYRKERVRVESDSKSVFVRLCENGYTASVQMRLSDNDEYDL